LIIGTGRTGTGFIAKLLILNHIPCGHEKVFGLPHDREIYLEDLRQTQLQGDSSWLAVPFLHEIKEVEPNLQLIHITRHPLKVIKSLCDLEFTTKRMKAPYRDVAFVRSTSTETEEIPILINYILRWYGMIEEHERAVLDIDNFDYDLLSSVVGKKLKPLNERVNTKIKIKRINRNEDELLAQIRLCAQYEELRVLSERYGFML
jgi:hypothetical protein